MRKIFTTIMLAAMLIVGTEASAQVKFGLKGGLNVTSMSFSEDVLSKDNQTGFFIGPTIKVTIPLAGLGVDAAVMYDQRDAEVSNDGQAETLKQKSINIPINLRYNIGLGSMASIYLAAGPQFGFNIGSKSFSVSDLRHYDMSDTNFSINVGAGVSVLRHLEIGFAYNIACGKTGEVTVLSAAGSAVEQVVNGRQNAWQVSAAYYF